MKTYIVSIVPEKSELTDNKNGGLTILALREEYGDIIYQDKRTGEFLVPARTGLSFQDFRLFIDKL